MRIVCWNVNGLYTTLKDAAVRHTSASAYFAQILKADIVCCQEAKIQEERLEKWMACVEGYHSHWAFSQVKKGYSGVVTYVREELSPLDAKADWLGEETTSTSSADESNLCKEGRLMCTDHGSFVLLNVYVPNAGDRDEGRQRLDFKLEYLKALEQTCDELVRSGKHVMVVGDFNIAHKDIDVHPRWKVEEMYSLEEREWLDGFFLKYVDLYRHFHPDEKDVYSVWNQKTEARIHNEGLRIDYAVCDKGFLPEVLTADVVKMRKQWSDHAAVVVVLKEQPSLPPHLAPALSSCNMRRFNDDPRQKKLTALFHKGLKRPTVAVSEPDKTREVVQSEGINSQPELAVSEDVTTSQRNIIEEADLPAVFEEHPDSVQPAESPGTTSPTTLSPNTECDEVASATKGAPESENKSRNKETAISNAASSPMNKNSVSQKRGKRRILAGKRKAELESKRPDTKQRSVSSFFKPANTSM